MFRTVTVYRGEKIAVKQGRLVVTSETGEQKLPIEDIYCLVVDNQQTVLTTAITRLQPGALKLPVIAKPDIYNDIDDE